MPNFTDEEWERYGICPPPTDANSAMRELINYLLGPDWVVSMPMGIEQEYTEALCEIEKCYHGADGHKLRYYAIAIRDSRKIDGYEWYGSEWLSHRHRNGKNLRRATLFGSLRKAEHEAKKLSEKMRNKEYIRIDIWSFLRSDKEKPACSEDADPILNSMGLPERAILEYHYDGRSIQPWTRKRK